MFFMPNNSPLGLFAIQIRAIVIYFFGSVYNTHGLRIIITLSFVYLFFFSPPQTKRVGHAALAFLLNKKTSSHYISCLQNIANRFVRKLVSFLKRLVVVNFASRFLIFVLLLLLISFITIIIFNRPKFSSAISCIINSNQFRLNY